jgi:hypothetical protein
LRAVRGADYVLVIAPESNELLATYCRWVEEANGRLLGPGSAAVQLTGDKLTLAAWLRARGVPTPECRLVTAGERTLPFPPPAVCKPRHGAGSQATFLIRDRSELSMSVAQARAEGCTDQLLIQPFADGQPASVAFLVGPLQLVPLLPAAQFISDDGRLRYLGGEIPLPPPWAERTRSLAARAVSSVPGLRGYVGVDLVLGSAEDGSADLVLEINPRLTTSYIGLRALARCNLAEAMLQMAQGVTIAAPAWRQATVRFTADGRITS